MALIQFNANEVEPQQEFQPLPAGWYNGMIVESDVKQNSAQTGSYLQLTVKVIDGQYANRQIFDILNLEHPNATAVEIAQKKLSAYCHATNVLQLRDTQQLHGVPFAMKIGVSVDKSGQYEPSNKITAVKAIGAAPAVAGSVPPAGFGSQPPASFGSRPAAQPQYTAPVAPPAPAAQPAPMIQPPPAQRMTHEQAPPAAAPAGNVAPPPWAKKKPA